MEEENLKDKVMQEIRGDKAPMHSRTYEAAKRAGLLIGLLVAAALIVYFISFVFFATRVPDADWAEKAVGRGFFNIFYAVPWLAIIIGAFLVIVAERLLRRYKFGYRRPAAYLFAVIVLLTLAASYFMERSRFHDRFAEFAEGRNFPVLRPFYHPHFRRPGSPAWPPMHRGTSSDEKIRRIPRPNLRPGGMMRPAVPDTDQI